MPDPLAEGLRLKVVQLCLRGKEKSLSGEWMAWRSKIAGAEKLDKEQGMIMSKEGILVKGTTEGGTKGCRCLVSVQVLCRGWGATHHSCSRRVGQGSVRPNVLTCRGSIQNTPSF